MSVHETIESQRKIIESQLDIYLEPYLKTSIVQSMDDYIQHGQTSTLQHSLHVSYLSFSVAYVLHLHLNYENLAVGALLHDFYLYDWHVEHPTGVIHGFSHPFTACYNALLYFHVNADVQQIITCHMWPLNITFLPRSKEAIIVCISDKLVTAVETIMGLWLFFYTLLFPDQKRG